MNGESKGWIEWAHLIIHALIVDHRHSRHSHFASDEWRENEKDRARLAQLPERHPTIYTLKISSRGKAGGVGDYGPYDDTSPMWDNAVRAYEDCRDLETEF